MFGMYLEIKQLLHFPQISSEYYSTIPSTESQIQRFNNIIISIETFFSGVYRACTYSTWTVSISGW